jgi:hypothetical protein
MLVEAGAAPRQAKKTRVSKPGTSAGRHDDPIVLDSDSELPAKKRQTIKQTPSVKDTEEEDADADVDRDEDTDNEQCVLAHQV